MKHRSIFLFLLLTWSSFSFAGKFDYVVSDISELFDHLDNRKIEHSWGAFAPALPVNGSVSALNIQFAVANGEVGLDWGLNSPENNRVLEQFLKAAKIEGITFQFIEAPNGFQYYRSVDKGIRDFPVKFLTEYYGMKSTDKVNYFSGGF